MEINLKKMIFVLLCLDIISFGKQYYQDIFINGEIIQKGERNCTPSWLIIDKFLSNYERPFTVLDLGAAQGFFSFNIAYKYDATCVMMENSYDYVGHVEKLLELCFANKSEKIIFLKHEINSQCIEEIAKSEHFDVVLALNVLHHAGSDYISLTDAVFKLGDYVIVENPPAEEFEKSSLEFKKRKYIEDTLIARGGIVLGYVPRHTHSEYKSKIILLKCNKDRIQKRHILSPLEYKVNEYKEYKIHSTFKEKKIEKVKLNTGESEKNDWIPGINLVTYKFFNGIFPDNDFIIKQIYEKKDFFIFDDLCPNNLIIQGSNLYQIDIEDPGVKLNEKTKANTIQKIVDFIHLNDKNLMKKYYMENYWAKRIDMKKYTTLTNKDVFF